MTKTLKLVLGSVTVEQEAGQNPTVSRVSASLAEAYELINASTFEELVQEMMNQGVGEMVATDMVVEKFCTWDMLLIWGVSTAQVEALRTLTGC